jgi:signal transduction histidine kinase/CheY-like chemotaxis protein/HPt (histidine-containing phosphotransfer) domain-containing protein
MHPLPAPHGGKLLRVSFALIITIILALCYLLFRQAGSWRSQQQWVEHSYQVRLEIEELDRSLREAESTQRVMLLFEEEENSELRAKYEVFKNHVGSNLERLRSLVSDNPRQREEVTTLTGQLADRIALLERNSQDLRQLDRATRQERLELGVAQTEAIDRTLGVIRDNEARLLDERGDAARTATDQLLTIAGVGSVTGVVVLILTFLLDQRNRRTERAYQDKLAEARDVALDSVKTTSNFVASVSHEIRTPMNGILGASDLLSLDPRLGKEQLELVEVIRRSSESLLALINDILDLSKLQAGKMDFVPEDFALIELLDEVLALFAGPAGRKQLELTYRLEQDLPRLLRGDSNRLRQVLVNLVGNAVKFTEAGSVVVSISQMPVGDARPVLRFRVTDTGPGLSVEEQSLLFQPFGRVNPSLRARHGGTGLGLAISREIVLRLEGSMGVESVPGQGATFWFTARFALAESPQRPSGRLGGGGSVLLIEGRDQTARSMEDHVMAWGMKPWHIADPSELSDLPAIDALKAVVVGKPLGGSWREAVQAISRRSDFAGARVLVMVAPGDTLEADELARLGVHGRLRFPFRPSDLYNQLAEDGGDEALAMEPSHDAPEQLPKARVLLVEDNPVNQRVFSRQLEALGMEVTICADGAEGVAARAHGTEALILMDCQLPVMDGFEATRRIRQWEAEQGKPRLPIIAVTAHVMVGDAEACFQAGMDDYLPKPFDLARLRRVLARWLRGDTATASATATKEAADEEPLLIDFNQFDVCLTGEPEIDGDLIEMALNEADDRLAEMQAALSSGDDDAWRRAAHRGRGSSATLGFVALADAFARCENDAGPAADRVSALNDLASLSGITRRTLAAREFAHADASAS